MNSVEYTYRIFAINAAGDSDYALASAITLAHAAMVPSEPASILAAAGSGMVTLSWDPPAFTAARRLRLRLPLKEGDGSYNSWRSADADAPPQEVPNLKASATYTFEVSARNTVGRGAATESAAVTVVATAPTAAPTQFTVSLGRDSE